MTAVTFRLRCIVHYLLQLFNMDFSHFLVTFKNFKSFERHKTNCSFPLSSPQQAILSAGSVPKTAGSISSQCESQEGL